MLGAAGPLATNQRCVSCTAYLRPVHSWHSGGCRIVIELRRRFAHVGRLIQQTEVSILLIKIRLPSRPVLTGAVNLLVCAGKA